MLKDAYYFPHDSNSRNDDKIVLLRMKLGWEGYGLFWAIIERLRESSNYTSVYDFNLIAYDLRTDAAKIKSIINDFGLFAFTEDGKCFYSERLMRDMEVKDETKKKLSDAGKLGNAIRWQSPPDSHPIATQSLKEKKRVENKRKEVKAFTPPTLEEFKAYWKENGYREDVSERTWKGYSEADWHDSKGSPVKNWKQKCQNVWFKDEHKIKQVSTQTQQRAGIFKKAIKIIPESLCVIHEDNFSSRCTPQEAQQFKEGIINISYFDKEF